MRSEGQQLAFRQLEEIAFHDNYVFEIIDTIDQTNSYLRIDVSLYCGDFERSDGGLPLRQRERFRFFIPGDFPLSPPSIHTPHTRFAGWPHVQWKTSLCLYQSTQSEWNPGDGMYGFMKRLMDWLKHGALNELDPTGQPLHPPVAYRIDYSTSILVPKEDTPRVVDSPWIGLAELGRINDKALSIVGWKEIERETPRGKYAATILLPNPFPFEYPQNSAGLLSELKISGVDFSRFLLTLQAALLWKDDNDPLLMVIGTPMRGIKGEPHLKQHLSGWEFDPLGMDVLKLSLNKFDPDEKIREIGVEVEALFKKYMENSKIKWCRVNEDRKEIVTRRDHASGLSVFKGKTVSIWGCGALGANIALHLTRAGVKKLVLRDRDIVTPGILVRQPYREEDIGYRKIDALEVQIRAVNKNVVVEQDGQNIKSWLSQNPDWSDGADLIIDCTASNLVHTAFELCRKEIGHNRVPIVSMVVDGNCEKGLLVQLGETFSGGILDASRKALLAVSKDPNLKAFADAFYPDPAGPRPPMFQPEPGCSDPTFVGSSADSAILAGLMLDIAGKTFPHDQQEACAWFISKSLDQEFRRVPFTLPHDYVTFDKVKDYEIRIASGAWKAIQAQINRNNRMNGNRIETGGLLYGQRDDALKVIWIDSATEPPPDSEAAEEHFICGVEGTKTISCRINKLSRGMTKFIGMWHTHPTSKPLPSEIDLSGMAQILYSEDCSRKKSLLLIVQPEKAEYHIGGYLFERSDFERGFLSIYTPRTSFKRKGNHKKNIGLALSGGGSRAIAFHLGCLRALNDRELLNRLDVISSVSGGSVIAALYTYSDCSFSEFEQRVVNLLKSGIDLKIAKEFFISTALLKELYQYITKLPLSIINRVIKNDRQLRRMSYRTLSFIEVLQKYYFGDKVLTDRRRDDLNIVINASELRTGTAFRFGSKESGCWRFGMIEGNNVSVAEAVALSAAYPLFLPALDKDYTFTKQGQTQNKRVVLSDGGIYDNTGVSCMEPGRDMRYSTNVYRPDYIICCNAGHGMLSGDFIPFGVVTRLNQVLTTTLRKSQDSTMKTLHHYKVANLIKGFILPYLGQIDGALPYFWPNLTKREQVNYPTNFRPMSDKDIELLSMRGEQLTRLLIDYYCPDL